MNTNCTLTTPNVSDTLAALHNDARHDWKPMIRHAPQAIWGLLCGKSMMKALTPEMMKDAYIPVSPRQGRYLYSTAVGMGARHIVEFGSSFGIGTLYLAAAARDTDGHVTTTEIEPHKCEVTRANLVRAGLSDRVSVLEGDALQTLQTVQPGIDLVFLDGWKDLYNDVLDLLLPKLRYGSIVIGDNVNLAEGKDYLKRVQKSESGFITALLDRNTAISTYVGAA